MVKSMTGYGFEEIKYKDAKILVEIRTVNSRYMDFKPKIPHHFLYLENTIKQIISAYFHRGRVDVFIQIDGDAFTQKTIKTDWELLDQYINKLEEIKKRYGLQGDIPLHMLASLPEVISVIELDDHHNDVEKQIVDCIKKACEQVVASREKEGNYLLKDISERASFIQKLLDLFESRRTSVVNEYKEKIKRRIEEYTKDEITFDDTYILHEIALLAEKGDITEEITRMNSHLDQLFLTIQKETGPIGRKLDFIMQELLREANTIGSKSTDREISSHVVTLKSTIEKMKEQIQNIE